MFSSDKKMQLYLLVLMWMKISSANSFILQNQELSIKIDQIYQ